MTTKLPTHKKDCTRKNRGLCECDPSFNSAAWKTESTHTPTPWHIEGLLSMDLSEGLKIENKNTIVAEICGGIHYDEALANAAFIVRATNHYEVMLDLLRRSYSTSEVKNEIKKAFDSMGEVL